MLDDVRRRHLADFACLLPLPDRAIYRLDVLSPEGSKELLGELLPGKWLAAETEAVDAVVELLERIPLALTLAARRARRIAGRKGQKRRRPLMTVLEELRARRIQVLNQGEDPDRPDLSVVITFDASYDDLDKTDQARLRRLGAFARNEFGLAALQAVWGDTERGARGALERLVNAGLVEESGADAWWMHDLLREYAAERLEGAGDDEATAARLAHAAYWWYFLRETTPRSVEDWSALETHRPEIQQAADWLLGDWQRAPELAALLAASSRKATRDCLRGNQDGEDLAG